MSAKTEPAVTTLIVEDGVDSDLDVQVKILDHHLTDDPDDRLIHLSYANAGPHGNHIIVPLDTLRRILAAVPAPGQEG